MEEAMSSHETMSAHTVVAASIDAVALKPAPIEPAWILDGSPVARAGEIARSTDGTAVSVVWDCTAGTFAWHFGADETVHIVEGEVEVSADGFGPRILRAGDAALFRAGTTARWHVPAYVKKIAYCRDPLPWPLAFALRVLARARSLLSRAPAGIPLTG
jgi:uncharacterized cupin superfamily protein